MLNMLPGLEAGPGLAADTGLAAEADLAASNGREAAADLSAGAPFSLGAFLPSAIAAAQSSAGTGMFRGRRQRAEAAWQRQVRTQRPATSPCRTLAQPDLSQKYPHTTRIAAANGDAQGPHPARDPV
jgi:hypothetical protein